MIEPNELPEEETNRKISDKNPSIQVAPEPVEFELKSEKDVISDKKSIVKSKPPIDKESDKNNFEKNSAKPVESNGNINDLYYARDVGS